MKWTISQSQLSRGLSIVSHAVPGKPVLPIQSSLLAVTDRGRIRLSAMKEDIGIHCWVPADAIEHEGAALLPAKLLTEVVSNLPASSITLTTPSAEDATMCHLHCQRVDADLKLSDADPGEFPSIPTFASGGSHLFSLECALLKQAVEHVAFAACTKEAERPALLGVLIEIENGIVTFAAADSFRMAVRSFPLPDDYLQCSLLVSAKTLIELAKILPSQGTVGLNLTLERHQLVFHTEHMDVSTRLLEASFPKFRGVIPSECTTRAVVRTHELSDAVRLMIPFTRGDNHVVRFHFCGESPNILEQQTVGLEAVAQDLGKNENRISAQIEGPAQEIIFSIDRLADLLAILDEEEVVFEISTPQRPVAIKPVGLADYTYVIMPTHTGPSTPVQQQPQASPVTA